MSSERFATVVFRIAGTVGLLTATPQFFLETKIGLVSPPPITHPEYFYGFAAVGLPWQILFFVIARDPVHLRSAMIPSVIEKLAFGIAVLVLSLRGRVGMPLPAFGMLDLLMGGFFAAAYIRSPATIRIPAEQRQ